MDLATHDRSKSCHEVAAEPSAAHDHTEALSQHAHRSVAGYVLGCYDDQWRLLCDLLVQGKN
jgi:hypothetical protein